MSLKTNLFRFIFISVLGVLLHFTYEWSGDNAVVGLFSAVNESTWEHLKLLFFPFLLLTILEVLLRGNMLPEQFLPARVLGILAGMGGIVVGFYTLRGVLGRNYDALNIALYFAGVLLALFVENKRYRKSSLLSTKAAAAVLLLLTVAFSCSPIARRILDCFGILQSAFDGVVLPQSHLYFRCPDPHPIHFCHSYISEI